MQLDRCQLLGSSTAVVIPDRSALLARHEFIYQPPHLSLTGCRESVAINSSLMTLGHCLKVRGRANTSYHHLSPSLVF